MKSPPPEPEFIFPFDGMELGSSFFIPTLKPAEMIYIIDTMAKDAGIKVKSYTVQNEGILGVRSWRIR